MFTSGSISPQQRLRAAHLSSVRQLARVRILCYGLPVGWLGVRSTGATTFETGVWRDASGDHVEVHESVELLHLDGASSLAVTSSSRFGAMDDAALAELLPGGAGGSLTVQLDGRAVEFAAARREDVLVARWAGYDATVTVLARRWPSGCGLELVRVADLAPYHAGRLAELERRAGSKLT